MKKKFSNEGTKVRRLNKKELIYASISIAVGVIVFFTLMYVNRYMNNSDLKLQDIDDRGTVFIANTNIKSGTYFDLDMVDLSQIDISEVPEKAINDAEDLKNKEAARDIKIGEIITSTDIENKNIWTENDERFIEHQFNDQTVPVTFPGGSIIGATVDIMLFKANAADEVVVSKAKVVAAEGNKLCFSLNTDEREFLKEAVISDGELYITAYIDDSQSASEVTYLPEFLK